MISELQLLLSKAVPLALLPEGLVTLALIGLALSLLAGAIRPARVFGLSALVIFWVCATPAFANWMIATLERQHPPAAETLPHAEIAILLGGSVGAATPPRPSPELNEAADRIWYAAHLYKSGHAKRILAVGGNLPWDEAPRREGDVMRDMLITLGVPAEAISTATTSRNTYENAIEARAMMSGPPFEPVLLVTSAAHMPRALGVFRAAGIPADPAPCDFRSRENAGELLLDWLPHAGAFAMTSGALREWIGYYAYQWRGWL